MANTHTSSLVGSNEAAILDLDAEATNDSAATAAHVLVVDDSQTEAHYVAALLEQQGYRTSVAFDANQGIRMAKQIHPDLILMDLVFNDGISGYQATRKLHQLADTCSIPVVILSGRDADSDKVWGLRQGAVDYLVKPVEPKSLTRIVQSNLNV